MGPMSTVSLVFMVSLVSIYNVSGLVLQCLSVVFLMQLVAMPFSSVSGCIHCLCTGATKKVTNKSVATKFPSDCEVAKKKQTACL